MIKRLFLFILILRFAATAFSQFQYYSPRDSAKETVAVNYRHFAGDKNFSVSPNVMASPAFGVKIAGGLKFQVFLGKRVSLDADLVIGKDYMHGGPGLIAIPFWLLLFNGSGVGLEGDGAFSNFLFMLIAGVLSFEHMSYHIPLKKDWEVAPYVSLLRFTQTIPAEETSFDRGQFSFATGIQMDKYIKRFFISPYVEYTVGYRDGISGFNAGVGFGISFPRR